MQMFCFLLTFLFCLATGSQAYAEQPAAGQVISTRGDQTIVELTDGKWQEGGRVDLGFKTPDGEYISAGSWCIHVIRERKPPKFVMELRKVQAYGKPTSQYVAQAVLLEGEDRSDWLERAAQAGCGDAQVNLGLKLYGDGNSETGKRGYELVRLAAEQNHPDGLIMFGDLRAEEIRKQDGDALQLRDQAREEQFKWNLRAARIGSPQGMLAVCRSMLWGTGADINVREGKEWCRKAAEEATTDFIRDQALKSISDWDRIVGDESLLQPNR